MQSTIGSTGIQETTTELALADWLTEEFPVTPEPAFRGPPRRPRLQAGLLVVLVLIIGLLAGLGSAWALRGAADPSAAPRTNVSQTPSPTSYDVIGILKAVGPHSVRVSSGGTTATYQVTSATRITRGTVVVRLQTLKVGEQVTVRLGLADPTSSTLSAESISVKAAVTKPRVSARPTVAPTSAVVTPSPQVAVPAPSAVAPVRGSNGFGSGIGSRTIGGGFARH
jgi:hypothetical protein